MCAEEFRIQASKQCRDTRKASERCGLDESSAAAWGPTEERRPGACENAEPCVCSLMLRPVCVVEELPESLARDSLSSRLARVQELCEGGSEALWSFVSTYMLERLLLEAPTLQKDLVLDRYGSRCSAVCSDPEYGCRNVPDRWWNYVSESEAELQQALAKAKRPDAIVGFQYELPSRNPFFRDLTLPL